MRRWIVCLAAALSAAPAFARFEGELHMKMSAQDGGGTVVMSVSDKGMRSDMNMSAAGHAMTLSTIVKANEPGKAYVLNPSAKSYAVIDIDEMREMAGANDKKYTVKKLGKETVNGFETERLMVTSTDGDSAEVWVSKDLLDYADYSRIMSAQSKKADPFEAALLKAGASGFPVKSIQRTADGGNVIVELTKADKKKIPASAFAVPSGYEKQEGLMGAGAVAMPEEARKAMEEGMKNMTPEQRKMMEQYMKGGK